MNVNDRIDKWKDKKWFKVTGVAVKAILGLAIAVTFIFFAIMVYLLVQDYFYDETDVDKKEAVESLELEANS